MTTTDTVFGNVRTAAPGAAHHRREGEENNSSLAIGTIFAGAIFGVIFLAITGGNFKQAFGIAGYVTALILAIARPKIGFYIFLGLAFTVSQMDRWDSWTYTLMYHWPLKGINPMFSMVSFTPMEIHMIFVIIGTMICVSKKKSDRRAIIAAKPMAIYFGALGLSILYGMIQGGMFNPAFWEIRGKIYLVVFAICVPQLIRTEKDMRTVVWILLGSLVFKAAEAIKLYIEAGWSVGTTGWGDHEDAGYLATIFVFLAALFYLKGYKPQRRFLLAVFVPFVLAFIASDRRTVYAVLFAAMVTLLFMVDKQAQRRAFSVIWKAAIVGAVYLAAFWNSDSPAAAPARSIRMAFATDEEEAGSRERLSSNLYRKVEDYNLAQMVRKNPVTGIGYGTTLDYSAQPMPIFWDLGIFIPHNEILGVAAKMGFLGYVAFWYFYLSLLVEVTAGYRDSKDAYHKALLVLVMAAVVNHIVYSFYDITLTYYRNNVYLGTLLGLASVIFALDKSAMEEKAVSDEHPQQPERPRAHWIVLDEQRRVTA